MDLYPPIDQLKNAVTPDSVFLFTDAISTLTNWSAHAIVMWNKRFPTVEHAFHYKKFETTNSDAASEIEKARSPYEAMKIAKRYRADRREDWNEVKVSIMTELNREKFGQNQDAREVLLATGDRQLIENSPWDDFWGCGPDGNGKNMAGKILMQIRDELKQT